MWSFHMKFMKRAFGEFHKFSYDKILLIIWSFFKLDFIAFKVDNCSTERAWLTWTSSWRYLFPPKCYITCGHTIFITWRYPLNNSDVIRYSGQRLEDRLCNICNVLEDEFHFFCDCSKYTDLRNKMFQIMAALNNHSFGSKKEQFIKLMASTDDTILKSIGLFVSECNIS